MDTTESADGTPIAYRCTGSGPTLVLVVGAFCDSGSTAGLAALLAPAFSVVEYDRRGRGASGGGDGWSVQREVDDLAAVVAATGGTAAVYGHSSGGALALEAAAAGVPISRLAVYEPPYTADGSGSGGSTELLDGVRERIAAGDPDGAAVLFLTASGTPPEVVDAIRQGPAWPRMRALAPTLVHDLGLTHGGTVPSERFGAIGVPTLAVSGGDSPAWAARACAAVADAVPGAEPAVLPGQGHGVAHDAVAPLLLDWFRD